MTDLRKRAHQHFLIACTNGMKLIGNDATSIIDAMLTFREEGVKAERERCAKVCRAIANDDRVSILEQIGAATCAEAIEKGLT